jgi:putative ABC transport system permease protein
MDNRMILLTASRNISRNRKRSILSISAIALAVALICFMKSYVDGLMGDVARNVFIYETGHIKIIHKDYEREKKLMPLDLAIGNETSGYGEVTEQVRQIPDVEAVLPRTRFGVLIDTKDRLKNAMGMAVDLRAERDNLALEKRIIDGRIFREWAEGPGGFVAEIVVGKLLAADLGIKPGDRVTMMTRTAEEGLGHMTFTVAGIASFGTAQMDKAYFFLPLSTAAKFLRTEGQVTEILVLLKDRNQSRAIAAKINQLFISRSDKPYTAVAWERQDDGQYYTLITAGSKTYTVIYIVFLVLASLVIINTTMMTVLERIREIGTIAALGMRGREIVRLFFAEAVILSVIGSFFGVLVGGSFAFWLSRVGIDFAKLSGGGVDLQVSEIVHTAFGPGLLIFSFIFGVVVASVCAWFPATRAARIEPVEAMRGVL